MGSIYTGWATVTECAALGVIAALGIAAVNRHALDPHAARRVPRHARLTAITC